MNFPLTWSATWAISMRWIKPYSIVGRLHVLSASGLNQKQKSIFHSNRLAGESVLPAEKLQQAEESKDGKKNDYTVTEESI
ncbi:hypothetical protein P9J64_13470 [Deltaproteobacteria bacterium IMCC39524]|nr:hypothetical protein [Deltaproteobacteria bacterium IMCC39524]